MCACACVCVCVRACASLLTSLSLDLSLSDLEGVLVGRHERDDGKDVIELRLDQLRFEQRRPACGGENQTKATTARRESRLWQRHTHTHAHTRARAHTHAHTVPACRREGCCTTHESSWKTMLQMSLPKCRFLSSCAQISEPRQKEKAGTHKCTMTAR